MTQTNEKKNGDFIDLLELLIKNKEWKKAISIGEYLVTLDPEGFFAYRAMGFASLELEDFDQSEEYFLKALECGDMDPNTLLLIARLYSFRGDLKGEISWLLKVIERDPDNTQAAFSLAITYMSLGEKERAEEILQGIIASHPDHVLSRRALTDIYLSAQELDKAEEQLRQAVNLQNNDPQLLTDLAYVLKRKRKFLEARSLHFEALELDPNKFAHYSEIGDLYMMMGDADNALLYLRKANQIDPFNSLVSYNLGRAYLDLNRFEQSEGACKAALQHDPEMKYGRTNLGLNATLHLGWAYLNSGRLKEAEQCFRKNLHLMAPTYENLGRSLLRQEKYEECLQCFLRAVELEPENAMYWNLVGNAHLELNQLDKAQTMMEKAIALDPKYSLAYHDLGCIIARAKGRENEAMELFKHAISLDEYCPLPYYELACYYALQNQKNTSINFLRQAIQRGFKDRKHVDNDHDFDAFRNDEEFQKIVAQMNTQTQEEFFAELGLIRDAP